jgi:MerR family transcriptional regulator, thiopeptide resistance regulator
MKSQFLTIGDLAKSSGLSRSTLLYYDHLGLLKPYSRSGSNYRLYSTLDAERLERICLHRQLGIPLKEIRQIMDESGDCAAATILQRRLRVLCREIAGLQRQQRDILRILKQDQFKKEAGVINKDRWVEIMKAAGFKEQDMHNWHIQFEKMESEAHQEFLESLGISSEEIARIREYSRKGGIKS